MQPRFFQKIPREWIGPGSALIALAIVLVVLGVSSATRYASAPRPVPTASMATPASAEADGRTMGVSTVSDAPVAPTMAVPSPAPSATGYIVGTNAPPAQAAPAGVSAPVEPAVVYSDLAPAPTEPAGWHPPYRSGYSPTVNYVEVRP